MPPYLLTNFEIQIFYENELEFNWFFQEILYLK